MTTACECGAIFGEACARSASVRVRVEWMSEQFRASHEAAGASGLSAAGRYPANGASRLAVAPECADAILATEGDWARAL